ncbi:sugar phosphate isomerase/epimerase family protein [Arthrobacter sp. NPDC080031]|uniref:sugar phosphate isomerase/epimerase family protein n=1 Tax=Arthrobacter sp. NPDC080031 TaxID=3155918 RepID=UPI003450B481
MSTEIQDDATTPATSQELLPLSGCSFSWLHQAPLIDALRGLAENGLSTFELTTAPPHLFSPTFSPYERHELKRNMAAMGVQPISLNPSFVDLNLISTNPHIREVSEQQMRAEIELAHDLGASFVVLIPGRRHGLAPAPAEAVHWVLDDALERLVGRAVELGVTIALENSPYGFLGSGAELLEIADRIDSPNLGITYDVANALALEDPSEGLRRVARRLRLAHISDTWHDHWAHTSVGRGDVDFAAFAATLREIGFTGPTVYELVDNESPDGRLAADIANLAAAGWSAEVAPTLEVTR